MDTAVLRGVRGNPLVIGSNVLIGPRAYLTGCEVEDEAFLATGTTIFNGAKIGRRAEVRINVNDHLIGAIPGSPYWSHLEIGLMEPLQDRLIGTT